MNEDDLIDQSQSNILAKRKLFSLLKMGQMLGADFPVSNLEMREELDEMTEILGEELSLEDRKQRRNAPPPPKPFSISDWISDEPEEEKPAYTACKHNLDPNRPRALHTCPYKEEIKGDSTSLCTCCASCQTACEDDI